MPDLYGLELSGLSPDLAGQGSALARRQKVADALLGMSNEAIPTTVAGGFNVPISPFQMLGKLAQGYASKRIGDEVKAGAEDLRAKQRAGVADALAAYNRTGSDRTVNVPDTGAMTGTMDSQDAPVKQETIKGDPRKAVAELLANPYATPGMQQFAMQDYGRIQARELEKQQTAELMKALGIDPNAPAPAAPPAWLGPEPKGAFQGDPKTILAQLQALPEGPDKQGALRAFQTQMNGGTPVQSTAAPPAGRQAIVAAMMPGAAAGRVAPVLAAQQAQQIALADKKEGRQESAELRRELAAQSDQTRRELAANSENLRRELADAAARKPPPGFRVKPDGSGFEFIPGGPADPEVLAGKAGAKKTGEAAANAKLNLPQIEAQANDSIRLVDELLQHPGRKSATGVASILQLKRIPGTDAADFANRLDQIKGQQFLTAFNSLRGGGQITEIEGKKATDAIARMNSSTSWAEFDAAAKDYKDVVRGALGRAKQQGAGPQVLRFDANGNPVE